MSQIALTVNISKDDLRTALSELIAEEVEKALNARLKTVDDNALLNSKEVMGMLRISHVTLDRWIKNGAITVHKISSRRYFKRGEVLEAIERVKKYKR